MILLGKIIFFSYSWFIYAKYKIYNTKLYENKSYYHNMINRSKYYKYKEKEINDWNNIYG